MKKLLGKSVFWLVVVILFVIISSAYSTFVAYSVSNYNGITIVVDAGHGGRDGGSVGKNGTVEKTINLDYAKTLKNKLVKSGYRVVLTRTNDDGLYSAFAQNKKISDMTERMNIIKKTNPNLVISIHMNSFSDSSVCGANTYYKIDDEASMLCANYVQQSLHTYCDAPNLKAKTGDYFMVNCSYYTSILIECGFLSNPHEEKLLNSKDYKEKIIDSIYKGVLLYFGNNYINV